MRVQLEQIGAGYFRPEFYSAILNGGNMTDEHEEEGSVAYLADLEDFQQDPRNLNLQTQRGLTLVSASMEKRGHGRPAFAAKGDDGKNTVLGGNLSTLEVAPDLGIGNGKVFVKSLKSFDEDFSLLTFSTSHLWDYLSFWVRCWYDNLCIRLSGVS